MISHSVTRSERRWVLVFALGLVLLTGLPYLIAASQQGGVFTGFLIGVEDGNSYIAKMLAGAQGDWLFRSPYTAVAQGGALLYLPYILLGKLLGPGAQHAQLVLLFHLFRSLALVAVCFASYDFIAFFIKGINLRRLGLALATLAAGLGWVLLLMGSSNWWGSIPLDFYSPETFGFLANFSLPHLVLARALLLWALLAYLRSPASETRPWLASAIWLAMVLTHLITAALGLLLIFAHLVFTWIMARVNKDRARAAFWRQLRYAAWAIAGAAPVLLYNAWAYWQDSYLRTWAAQNQILSPSPLHYLFANGLLLPFAYFGLRSLLNKNATAGRFLLIWLALLPVLLYAPVGLQRRLAEGAYVMLIVLALLAFDAGRFAKRRRELWLFSLAFPSTLILLLGAWQSAQAVTSPVFRSADEIAAFEELRALADPGEVVLSAYETGNALPAWAPLRVLAGHGPESVDLERLLPRIAAFYQGRTLDDPRLELLQKYGVNYVFWGPAEQAFGSWQPGAASFLELIVDVGEYQIYQVIDD